MRISPRRMAPSTTYFLRGPRRLAEKRPRSIGENRYEKETETTFPCSSWTGKAESGGYECDEYDTHTTHGSHGRVLSPHSPLSSHGLTCSFRSVHLLLLGVARRGASQSVLRPAELLRDQVRSLQPMILPLILALMVQYDFVNRPVPEQVARQCAAEVGIPYASDNFTDTEWQEFKRCIVYRTGN